MQDGCRGGEGNGGTRDVKRKRDRLRYLQIRKCCDSILNHSSERLYLVLRIPRGAERVVDLLRRETSENKPHPFRVGARDVFADPAQAATLEIAAQSAVVHNRGPAGDR